MSPAEWLRCSNQKFLQVNAWEYCYYQHRDDSIPKEVWVGADSYYRRLVTRSRALSRFWSEYAKVFDEPFRSYVTGDFAKNETAPEPNHEAAP